MVMRPFGLVAKLANQIIFEIKTKAAEILDEFLHLRLIGHPDMLIIISDRQEVIELVHPGFGNGSKSPLSFSGKLALETVSTRNFNKLLSHEPTIARDASTLKIPGINLLNVIAGDESRVITILIRNVRSPKSQRSIAHNCHKFVSVGICLSRRAYAHGHG